MRLPKILLILLALGLAALLIYQIPAVHTRLAWRLDTVKAYARGVINPIGAIPTPAMPPPQVVTKMPTSTPDILEPTATELGPTPTPTLSPTPISAAASLSNPIWNDRDWLLTWKQLPNNCGPATLSVYLNYYGWDGDQLAIDDVIKPNEEDKNVNVEELIFFTRNYAGWLNSEFRVGGTIQQLKQFIAAGIPIMIEEGMQLNQGYWPNDDKWAGHYLLLTAYDDASGTFTGQDTFEGANKAFPYQRLDDNWKQFNRVFIMLYPPDREATVQSILGPHWDEDYNRQVALETAEAETAADPNDAYAWFNLGTNLVYFERYAEAANAYDRAREIGLPQRMLRYQFGPFIAYFHSFRVDDLLALTEYALQITDDSEEAHLWRGWALYRMEDDAGAIEEFRKAYEVNPTSADVLYALDFMGVSP